jgi:regulator of replication initiation timing
MELNQSNSRNSGLKVVVVILALLLMGSLAYVYKLQQDKDAVDSSLSKTLTEKEKFQEELESKIAEYDIAIADNTALKGELEEEQAKIMELLEKIKKSDGSIAELSKFKTQYVKLKREMDNLIAENNVLKANNSKLTKNLDSTNVVLTNAKTANDTLVAKNENLSKTVEKAQRLSVLNLTTLAVKQKGSGKQINTDKASKADVLKIGFTIAENQVAKTGDRTYYVQVIDSKNNVLGEKKTETFGATYLPYSFQKTIKYENKTVQVQEDLSVKNISAGTYFVNVFDKKGELVSKSSFQLR